MVVKILGIIDIIASLVLLLSGIVPGKMILVVGFYLIAKGILFNLFGFDFASSVDAAIGAFMVLGIYVGFSNSFFRVLFFVFLIQKGIFSLF
jgi:hypothetical protein